MRNAQREKERNFNNMKNAFQQSQINIEKKILKNPKNTLRNIFLIHS